MNEIKENPKISIIVPVYNVEQYVEKSIKSILNQTYRNLEIIIINDGSSDNSKEIIERVIQNDDRCILINQENFGIGVVRNLGLERATGDYIGWVDSDDWIEPTMYEKLMESIVKYGADVAWCDRTEHSIKGDTRRRYHTKKFSDCMEVAEDRDNLYRRLSPTLWMKLYKKEIFAGVVFPNCVAEDRAVAFKLLNNTKKISVVREQLYNYLIDRPSNTITTSNNKTNTDRAYVRMSIYYEMKNDPTAMGLLNREFISVYWRYLRIEDKTTEKARKIKTFIEEEMPLLKFKSSQIAKIKEINEKYNIDDFANIKI